LRKVGGIGPQKVAAIATYQTAQPLGQNIKIYWMKKQPTNALYLLIQLFILLFPDMFRRSKTIQPPAQD
jgi:hypothetical protein